MKMTGAQSRLRHPAAIAAGFMAAIASLACAGQSGQSGTGGDDAPVTTTAKGVEDVSAAVGGSLEVANLTATVTEVHRQKAFAGVADAGYLVAQVTVANDSSAAQKYHRLHFGLVKPDGTAVKRTPVAGETQLGDGELQPGEKVSGSLIFTVEQSAGRFTITFEPRQDDSGDRQRGVWTFDSQPGDAR